MPIHNREMCEEDYSSDWSVLLRIVASRFFGTKRFMGNMSCPLLSSPAGDDSDRPATFPEGVPRIIDLDACMRNHRLAQWL